jgi:hypothetical protein
MTTPIYLHKFGEPLKFIEKVNGKEYHRIVSFELRCDDPRVERVWEYGGASLSEGDLKMYNWTSILMKDGSRIEYKGSFEQINPQFEQYLKDLK